MAIKEVNRGGVDWWLVEESDPATWRMFWDSDLVVQDLFCTMEESLTLRINFAFQGAYEGEGRADCMAKIDELGLYFDPDVES